MKKVLPILLALLSFLACNTSTQEQSPPVQKASLSETQNLESFCGYYVKSAHEGAWLLYLQKNDTSLKGYLIKYAGMLPPHEFLDSPDAKEDVLEKHTINYLIPESKTQYFNSNVGKGRITASEVSFEEISDEDSKLKLVRAASYPNTP